MATTRVIDPIHLHGLVDMGSNGIRFSISDLSNPTTRILPTVYTARAGISLYDAQYSSSGERVPIPGTTINLVLDKLTQFKRVCHDFQVPESNITVLATEATRTAVNSAEYRQKIKEVTGWEVVMLAKEEEGRVGALGVATSLGTVKGLVMDLGGGSTQLTWLVSGHSGEIKMPDRGAVSMPFGAAALSRRLGEAEKQGNGARERFAEEIKQTIKEAYGALGVPDELKDLAKKEGGFALHLSGGGFRGWGYILMSEHQVTPYPIPVINGFRVSRSTFLDTASVQTAVKETNSEEDAAIFRISQRRADQVPAVAFLVTALSQALPEVKEVRFCQGGVREGFLFSKLGADIRQQSPLVVATQSLASPASAHFADLLEKALPPSSSHSDPRQALTPAVIAAYANMTGHFASHPKDIRAAAALRSTTTGVLASAHGLAHEERSVLALLLCERWGGVSELPPTDVAFFNCMQALVSPWTSWWAKYLGRVSVLLGELYPAGRGEGNMTAQASWGSSKKGHEVVVLNLQGRDGRSLRELFPDETEKIEKVGKKKNWVGGKDGCGFKVEVQ